MAVLNTARMVAAIPFPAKAASAGPSAPCAIWIPVLEYGTHAVTLGLRHNAQGLSTADAAWRGALLDDSRFPRESALAHTPSGRAWAQSWAANTERSGAQGLPGDDRDTGGLQIGLSRRVGAYPASGALAVLQGMQETRLSPLGRMRGAQPGRPALIMCGIGPCTWVWAPAWHARVGA